MLRTLISVSSFVNNTCTKLCLLLALLLSINNSYADVEVIKHVLSNSDREQQKTYYIVLLQLAIEKAKYKYGSASLQASAAVASTTVPPTGPLMQPAFAVAQALGNTANTYLDLTSSAGAKHFKGATKALSRKPFDFADPAHLQFFLDIVLKRTQIWGGIPSAPSLYQPGNIVYL